MLRQDFEQQTKKLIGHSITHVDYLEIDYTDKSGNPVKKPNWNRDKQFDSLDYGLDLITESGDVFWISWGCEFTCYGISIILNPIDNHKKNMRIWDVSYNSGWRSFIGQKITNIRIDWEQVNTDSNSIEYPQALEITFAANSHIYISVLELMSNGDWLGGIDQITIFYPSFASRSVLGDFYSETE